MPHFEIIIGIINESVKADEVLTRTESNIEHGDYPNQGKLAQVSTAKEELEVAIEEARDAIAAKCQALQGLI